jgi:hypothetical protein
MSIRNKLEGSDYPQPRPLEPFSTVEVNIQYASPHNTLREAVSAAFVVIVLGIGAFVAISSTYYSPSAHPNTAISTEQTHVLFTLNPDTDLEFGMALNTTTVQLGRTLAVSYNLFNTLDRVNNVTGAEDWRLTNQSENSGAVGWNCAQNDVFRIEVVSGYYGLNNFSMGVPLDVFVWTQSAFNQCLYYVRAANETAEPLSVPSQGQNNYAFSPRSNVAWWTATQDWSVRCGPANTTISYPCPQVGQKAVMNETMILKTGLFTNSIGAFTIIGGDEWGDVEVLHFYIGSATSQTTASGKTCTPAITLTRTSANTTTTQVITLCHTLSTYTAPITPTDQSHLELHATASPYMGSAQNINATIWEINTLQSTNDIEVAPSWSGILGIAAQGCTTGWPMGIGLLKGHYVASNVSQGQLVSYPFMFSCPGAQITLQSLAFMPDSSTAIATTNFGTPTWDVSQSFVYQNLNPGNYTVVACDEWGHTAFAYFTVTSQ